MEVHPELEEHKDQIPDIYSHIVSLVQRKVGTKRMARLDTADVWETVKRANGIPTVIGDLRIEQRFKVRVLFQK